MAGFRMSPPRLAVVLVGLLIPHGDVGALWAGEAQPARRPRRRLPPRRQPSASSTPRYLRTDWTRYMLSYQEEQALEFSEFGC